MRGQVYAVCEGKALPFVGVEAAVRDHAAIDQAAAGQFHPRRARVVAVAADDAAALFLLIADIDLGRGFGEREIGGAQPEHDVVAFEIGLEEGLERSEEHTSELQSLMRISYAVFCLKKKKK